MLCPLWRVKVITAFRKIAGVLIIFSDFDFGQGFVNPTLCYLNESVLDFCALRVFQGLAYRLGEKLVSLGSRMSEGSVSPSF